MPLTWIFRRIWLEPIQLPFLLLSILLAIHLKDSINNNKKSVILIVLSGISFGTAIFTKIPVFTMIPVVGSLIYDNNKNKNWKYLGLWFIPVILIPFIWPAYSLAAGQYDQWLDGVFWQAGEREKIMEHLDQSIL